MSATLVDLINAGFPELEGKALFENGIWLQNDSDGTGDYIASWSYAKAITDELKPYLR